MQLTRDQQDAFTELLNIGVGRAAASLSELVGERVELYAPRIVMCSLKALQELVAANTAPFQTVIFQDFAGQLSGRAALAFPRDAALSFGQLLGHVHAPATEMDLDVNGILMEVGNIVLNAVLGTVGNLADSQFFCTVPELSQQANVAAVMASHVSATPSQQPTVFLADAQFRVAKRNTTGSIVILFEVGGIHSIVSALTTQLNEDRGSHHVA